MKALYLERSTGSGRNGGWVEDLDLEGVDRIVVGTGPGSFAGIRAALAFSQGYALGRECEVLGLPSACAVAARVYGSEGLGSGGKSPLAVLGDARQGKLWVALFEGYALTKDVFQVKDKDVLSSIPVDFRIVSPDHNRIGAFLKGMFGERYLGEVLPTAEGLRLFAETNPSILKREPLPIYLNPAVRGE